jgi:hypothetical protein
LILKIFNIFVKKTTTKNKKEIMELFLIIYGVIMFLWTIYGNRIERHVKQKQRLREFKKIYITPYKRDYK